MKRRGLEEEVHAEAQRRRGRREEVWGKRFTRRRRDAESAEENLREEFLPRTDTNQHELVTVTFCVNSLFSPFHFFSLDFVSKNRYIVDRGNEMTVKIKPVQPTEIKDKKIILEVIEQIRKPIPASVYRKHKKEAEYLDKFLK